MTNEEAIAFLSQYIDNKCYTDKCQQAHYMAISAIRAAEKCDQNETEMRPGCNPLTLEQLREMDGHPVWVHVIDHTVFADKEDDFDGWGMCRKSWVRIWDSNRADIVHIDYDFECYGKEWIAYAYHTSHIDREAWKPCINCEHVDILAKRFKCWPSYCPKCGAKMDGGEKPND